MKLSPFNIALLAGLTSVQMPTLASTKNDMPPLGADKQQVPLGVKPLAASSQFPVDANRFAGSISPSANLLRSILSSTKVKYEIKPTVSHPIKIQQWFSEMSGSLVDIASEAEGEGLPVPSESVMKNARSALAVCSKSSVAEPSITHDDRGGIEIFFKNNDKAIMIAVQADGFITIYGDDPDEQWRGRYKSSGTAWRRHLSSHIAEVAAV